MQVLLKINVLIVSTSSLPVPPRTYGGVERVVFDLAVSLHRLGHCVTVAAPEGSNLPEGIGFLSTGKGGSSLLEVSSLRRCLPALKDFDVVCDFSHTKILGSIIHPDQPVYIPVCGTHHLPRLPTSKPRLVCVSEAHRAFIMKKYGYDSRVIYNGINTSFFRPDGNSERKERLLFMGRFVPEKGALEAIRISRKLKMPIDVVEGRTKEPFKMSVFRFLASLNAPGLKTLSKIYHGEQLDLGYFLDVYRELKDPHVKYFPEVVDSEKKKLMNEDSVFIFPLRWEEPFGLTVAEAQAAGMPVVAYRRGSMPELIVDGRTGFVVEPDDEEQFANKVKEAANLNREDCVRNAVERFDRMVMAKNYERIFAEALGGERW